MNAVLRTAAPMLVFVLLLQVVLAPLHCLAMAGSAGGLETVICSPEGTRVIHLDAEGQPIPADDPTGAACFVCADTARAVLPAPLATAAPRAVMIGQAWHAAAAAHLPPPARAPPYSSRAPPAHA